MQAKLKIKNIVMVGWYNLQMFDKYFFIKNNILKEEDILPESMFNSMGGIIQIVTTGMHISILQNQLIISNLETIPEIDEDRNNIMAISILQTVGLINVTALGMNFHWNLSDNSKSLDSLSNELFYNKNDKLMAKFFTSEGSMFGTYASTVIKDARLKLDAKPMIFNNIEKNALEEVINFQFNFHFDIKNPTDNSELLKYISDYDFYKSESKKMISIYN